MTTTWYKHKIHCETEGIDVYKITEDTNALTTCPNDSGHTVTTGSARIQNTLSNNETIILEEKGQRTGGQYKLIGHEFEAAAGPDVMTEDIYTTDYPTTVLSGLIGITGVSIGDKICIDINPNTTVGVISSNVFANDTVINVTSTVPLYAKVGYWCTIFDGVNTSNEVLIIGVDAVNNTITVKTGIDQLFTVGSAFRITVRMIENFKISSEGHLTVGQVTIGGAYLPTGSTISFKYMNKTGSVKDISYSYEVYY